MPRRPEELKIKVSARAVTSFFWRQLGRTEEGLKLKLGQSVLSPFAGDPCKMLLRCQEAQCVKIPVDNIQCGKWEVRRSKNQYSNSPGRDLKGAFSNRFIDFWPQQHFSHFCASTFLKVWKFGRRYLRNVFAKPPVIRCIADDSLGILLSSTSLDWGSMEMKSEF